MRRFARLWRSHPKTTLEQCTGQAFASLKGGFALARYLAAAGELTEVPGRSPPRAPPYWKSQVLRRQALGDQSEGGDDRADHEAAQQADGKLGTPPRLRSLAHYGGLGAFHLQRDRVSRAPLRPNYAGPTPIAAPRPREWDGKPPSNRLRSSTTFRPEHVSRPKRADIQVISRVRCTRSALGRIE